MHSIVWIDGCRTVLPKLMRLQHLDCFRSVCGQICRRKNPFFPDDDGKAALQKNHCSKKEPIEPSHRMDVHPS